MTHTALYATPFSHLLLSIDKQARSSSVNVAVPDPSVGGGGASQFAAASNGNNSAIEMMEAAGGGRQG